MVCVGNPLMPSISVAETHDPEPPSRPLTSPAVKGYFFFFRESYFRFPYLAVKSVSAVIHFQQLVARSIREGKRKHEGDEHFPFVGGISCLPPAILISSQVFVPHPWKGSALIASRCDILPNQPLTHRRFLPIRLAQKSKHVGCLIRRVEGNPF